MNDLIHSLEACIKNQEWYGALVIALIIPSVATAAAASNNRDTQEGYIKWCNVYVKSVHAITGLDIYKVRCSLLHEGRAIPDTQGAQSQYKRIVFTLPSEQNITAFNNRDHSLGSIDVELEAFVTEIAKAAKAWLVIVKNDIRIQQNLSTTVQQRRYDFGGIFIPDKKCIY